MDQDKPQPIWDVILNHRPQVFVLLGDNIYTSDLAPQAGSKSDAACGIK